MVRLDGTPLIGDELTIKDINQLATPFMLNAALPSAFIQALQHGKTTPKSIKVRGIPFPFHKLVTILL